MVPNRLSLKLIVQQELMGTIVLTFSQNGLKTQVLNVLRDDILQCDGRLLRPHITQGIERPLLIRALQLP